MTPVGVRYQELVDKYEKNPKAWTEEDSKEFLQVWLNLPILDWLRSIHYGKIC